MSNKKPLSEQEWVYQYVKNSQNPLPIVMGTKGTWGMNGKPWIILIAGTYGDAMVLCDIHNLPIFHIRKMKIHDLTYFAASITDPEKVKKIILSWDE
ncbi:hypothetical protein [Ammoniphilus sp. 3BR4]|uniref:hypothetical protein n=1 Tax=Ammoniphilus sp. 3BR4 TaxID=3158265 RepID=UPI00346611EA